MAVEAVAENPQSQSRPLPASPVSARVSHRLNDVAAIWAGLEAGAIESPGQSSAFIRAWVAALEIPPENQFYVTAEIDGAPVALMALWRRRAFGVRTFTWFPGAHVGCNAPLADAKWLAAATPDARRALWSAMIGALSGADLVYLRAVPQLVVDGVDLFAELGRHVETELLHRAQFTSFEEADATQRSRSRRKHDRQQSRYLEALGEVGFSELRGTPDARPVLDTLFRQRAARFVEMGIADPFAEPRIRAFYESTLDPASGIDVRMHVLRVDGEIAAMRYNIAHGDRQFCLVSSMSDDRSLQTGSPGKQCLLRVMQTVFDAGWRVFDIGAGINDEKRQWCNVQVALRQHYVPLTPVGGVAGRAHLGWQVLRRRIKANPRLMGAIRAVRARLLKAAPPTASADAD